ncbi:MFS transporter [Herbiconiux ginsengi]|nr:MFS transporter [Herbiconiux ginsengi]
MEPTQRPNRSSEPITPLTSSIPAGPGEAMKMGQQTKEKLPRELRPLFRFAPFVAAVPFLAFSATNYFAAVQAQQIDDAGKVGALATISAISAFAAMLAMPLAGVLTDRTRTRFGARRPWILVGAVIGSVAMITAGLAPSIAALTIAVVFVQFGFNAMGAPFTAILPDRVPVRFRGRYSTLVGLGTLLAGVLGGIIGSFFVKNIPLGYTSIAGAVLLLTIWFVVAVKDRDNRGEHRQPFNVLAFLKAFWVSPIKHPDFFWGFLGRFLLFGGFSLLNTYSLYILQDYIGVPVEESLQLAPLLGLATLPTILISTAISGPLSDRIGRRKPLVLAGGLVIALAALVPILMPSVPGMIVSAVFVGLGFGTFIAVDQALISSVLPDKERFGTDLGVLNIASTLPGVIGPAVAGVIVLVFGGYLAIYVAVVVIALLGALAVMPIKSVR